MLDLSNLATSLSGFVGDITGIDYMMIALNIIFIVFARPLLKKITSDTISDSALSFRVALLRGLNVTILVVYYYEHVYKPFADSANTIRFLSPILVLYLAYISNFISQYFIQKQYGKEREIGGEKISIATYQTRVLSILAAILITVVAIISIVKILGFDSLLEAGGVLGFIGVMLALTQASWAPDIISGLIFLNSSIFEEGDVIEIEDNFIGRVYKTKLFHTEILNLVNNHRTMVRNAKLRDNTVHNLSKFASIKGLRDCLSFNIGYDVDSERVKTLLNEAFEKAVANKVPLEAQHLPMIKLLETGDHALTWGCIFYIKNVTQIINIRRDFKEIILSCAITHNISLATPITHTAQVKLNRKTDNLS